MLAGFINFCSFNYLVFMKSFNTVKKNGVKNKLQSKFETYFDMYFLLYKWDFPETSPFLNWENPFVM